MPVIVVVSKSSSLLHDERVMIEPNPVMMVRIKKNIFFIFLLSRILRDTKDEN